MKEWFGWHFLQKDRRLRWGTQEVVETGKTYTVKGKLEMCYNGLHASARAIDALLYAPGPIVCRVELLGERIDEEDKSVAQKRRVIVMADATQVLHEFSCHCATAALCLAEIKDKRYWHAIEAKWSWLRGDITDAELALARSAARSAVSDGPGDPGWDAAWYVAWAVARDHARDAAGAAARAAAFSALLDTVRNEQNDLLEDMLSELLKLPKLPKRLVRKYAK